MRSYILKLGKTKTVLLATLCSVVLSALINTIVRVAQNNYPFEGVYISIITPLIIAPAIVWLLVNFLYTTNELKQKLESANIELSEKNIVLQNALSEINTLREIIPICASCKKIRNDHGYYESVENYISRHSQIDFSHTVCPDCLSTLYPEVYVQKNHSTFL